MPLRWPSRTLAATFVAASALRAQQVPDSSFAPKVGAPAFTRLPGPAVLIDEAHFNFHTASGRYTAFARLLRQDGYQVVPSTARFSRATLNQASILVIANALALQNETDWELPTFSAFDSSEITAVHDWVNDGGSLLLIADHMPFPGAAAKLAASLGILMSNGFVVDATSGEGNLRFSRDAGTLSDNPITRGRTAAERIDSVATFTGQGFRLEHGGTPILTFPKNTVLLLPQVAFQFSRLTPQISASGFLQGAVLQVGKGRVAVFGEAAMFSAQLEGPDKNPIGMNDPTAPQNAQFALNVLHWLSGVLH